MLPIVSESQVCALCFLHIPPTCSNHIWKGEDMCRVEHWLEWGIGSQYVMFNIECVHKVACRLVAICVRSSGQANEDSRPYIVFRGHETSFFVYFPPMNAVPPFGWHATGFIVCSMNVHTLRKQILICVGKQSEASPLPSAHFLLPSTQMVHTSPCPASLPPSCQTSFHYSCRKRETLLYIK